jgi:hypothetical protein
MFVFRDPKLLAPAGLLSGVVRGIGYELGRFAPEIPEKTARPEDVPDDYLPPPVGSRADVASAVCKLFRNAESDGESFVTIERSGFTIEIILGDEQPCSQLLLHVHVDDDATTATKAILRLADHFGMRALDCSTSEFMEAEPTRRASQEAPTKKRRSRRSLGCPAADYHFY